MTSMTSSRTVIRSGRTPQPQAHTPGRILGIGSSRDRSSTNEAPFATLRVQIISCHDLEAKDSNGFSDPYVVVSMLGKEFKTPVCKRNLNPIYKPQDATFEFPIHMSLVQKLGTLNLKFVVWDKDMIGKDFLGKNSLSVNEWFKGAAFSFDDPENEPILIGLLSSCPTTMLYGTMRIKVGFVPPNPTSQPDFRNIFHTLANPTLAPQIDHVGIVTLLISGARHLPDWPTVTHIGWDMDPYVKVTIGGEAKCTQVKRHNREPDWDEQLFFHVRKRDLSLPILLSVYDWDRFSFDDHVGDATILISQLVGKTSRRDRTSDFYPNGLPTMEEFRDVRLIKNPKRPYKRTPTLTFSACYQSYEDLRKQVGH
ncbi:C2 domain-containing protein [Lactarius quietus]|nr:C2 domain-containing protein [Lactarius quietus]